MKQAFEPRPAPVRSGGTRRAARLGLALSAAIGLAPPAGAQDMPDCDAATTTAEMTTCIDAAYEAEVAAMEDAVAAVRALLEPADQTRFDEVQAAWLGYRDLSADLAGDLLGGGTLAPLVATSRALILTQDRRIDLETLLGSVE